MKKFVVTLLSLVLCFGISACGTEASLDLTGEWIQPDSDSSPSRQIATINDESIEIYWEREGEDEPELVWAGSYVAPDSAVEKYSWTSENDTEKTSKVIYAMDDETLEFTYEDGIISYDYTVLGSTLPMKLERK